MADSLVASLVAQMVKNLPAMQETWVQSLGREDPLEKGVATRSSILQENPMDRGASGLWRGFFCISTPGFYELLPHMVGRIELVSE